MKLSHCIFLIVGTCIGAGILALPLSTAPCGFWGSLFALIITGAFMTYGALNMLRARLYFEKDVDLETMSKTLLGPRAAWILRLCYLCLLFALAGMYITVGGNWIRELVQIHLKLNIASLPSQLLFTGLIMGIIYGGLGNLAHVNQWITGLKLICLFLIIGISMPEIEPHNLASLHAEPIPGTFSMLLTTFGFSIIIPSLATYVQGDRRTLTLALGIGSILIVLIYLLWEGICFGIIGDGPQGLMALAKAQDKGTGVLNALTLLVHAPMFSSLGLGIMLTAVVTSFLGVGQCLYNYIQDLLPNHTYPKKPVAMLFGFLPPLFLIQAYPAGITQLLSLAGIFVALVLGVFPNTMVLGDSFKKSTHGLKGREQVLTVISLIFFSGCILLKIWDIVS